MEKAYVSQQGSEGGKKKDKREIEGHMALRHNVARLKLDLWKELKPLEYFLIDVIIDKTIAWRVKEAKISIKDFMNFSGHDHTRIYRTLKSLEKKKVIVRKKHNHNLIFGLNEEYFGGLLTKRHQDALDRRRRIKVVVDNSNKVVPPMHNSCANHAQLLCQICTKTDTQGVEIIHETAELNKFFKDTSLKAPQNPESATGNAESYALEESGTGWTSVHQPKTGQLAGKEFNLEERRALLMQQAEMLIARQERAQ